LGNILKPLKTHLEVKETGWNMMGTPKSKKFKAT
jgi:hypothetical protein